MGGVDRDGGPDRQHEDVFADDLESQQRRDEPEDLGVEDPERQGAEHRRGEHHADDGRRPAPGVRNKHAVEGDHCEDEKHGVLDGRHEHDPVALGGAELDEPVVYCDEERDRHREQSQLQGPEPPSAIGCLPDKAA